MTAPTTQTPFRGFTLGPPAELLPDQPRAPRLAGAAWALASFGENGKIVVHDDLASELGALSVPALRLAEELRASLHHLGIETIGPLMKLPRRPLPARFDARDQAITGVTIRVTGFTAIQSPYEAIQFIDGNGQGKQIQGITRRVRAERELQESLARQRVIQRAMERIVAQEIPRVVGNRVQLRGPAEAPIARVRGRSRFQVWLASTERTALTAAAVRAVVAAPANAASARGPGPDSSLTLTRSAPR